MELPGIGGSPEIKADPGLYYGMFFDHSVLFIGTVYKKNSFRNEKSSPSERNGASEEQAEARVAGSYMLSG